MLSSARQMVACVLTLFCLASSLGIQQIGTAQPAAPQGEKTIVDYAIALWRKGDCEGALAEFRKCIEADAGNLAHHEARSSWGPRLRKAVRKQKWDDSGSCILPLTVSWTERIRFTRTWCYRNPRRIRTRMDCWKPAKS